MRAGTGDWKLECGIVLAVVGCCWLQNANDVVGSGFQGCGRIMNHHLQALRANELYGTRLTVTPKDGSQGGPFWLDW